MKANRSERGRWMAALAMGLALMLLVAAWPGAPGGAAEAALSSRIGRDPSSGESPFPAPGALADPFAAQLERLAEQWGLVDTEYLYAEKEFDAQYGYALWRPGWTARDLNGLLTADVRDWDGDGADEMLCVRLATDGASGETALVLSMYECDSASGEVLLMEERALALGDGFLQPDIFASIRAGCMAYSHAGRCYLLLVWEDYSSGGETTLARFSWNGGEFDYAGGLSIVHGGDGSAWCGALEAPAREPLQLWTDEWEDVASSDDLVDYDHYDPEAFDAAVKAVENAFCDRLAAWGLTTSRFRPIGSLEELNHVNGLVYDALWQPVQGSLYPICDVHLYINYSTEEDADDYIAYITLFRHDLTEQVDVLR